MAGFIALILTLQLVGEITVRLLGLPVPGPVLGMLLLFAALAAKGHVPERLEQLANALLSHLALLFVPAGVGVISYLGWLADDWLPVLLTVIGSTLVAIVATAFTLRLLLNRGKAGAGQGTD